MFKQTKKFLLASAFCLVVLCIAVFLWLGSTMGDRSQEAISKIGTIYMSELNRQLQQKFTAIVDLQMAQVEGIVKRTPPDTVSYGDEMIEELKLSGSVREFSYLALYAADGEFELILGQPVTMYDETEFRDVLNNRERKVTSGYFPNGEKLCLLSMDVEYPMKNGKKSSLIVAGVPMAYMEDALVLDEKGAVAYSHIIRGDGSFVVRSGGAYRDNYFTRIHEAFSELNGKSPDDYAYELYEAMQKRETYSVMVLANGEYSQQYCSALPDSTWYLVSVMPHSNLNDAIIQLSNDRQTTMIKAFGVILAAMVLIFFLYYRMSQQQLREIERAEQEAVQANRAKSEFLSNMSHDIRTPMNGIVGMTAIAMTNIDDTARVENCLKKITLSSKHLLGLINDVLDMSKIESGKLSLNMDMISLRDTMNSLVSIVQPQIREKGQHFDIFIQEINTEEVLCDSVRLNQILINLLSNALKFTPEGGRVNVYLNQEVLPDKEGYIRCHFRVKDTGIGMTKEFQSKIFETFTREESSLVSKTEGTGLGMAITKYIVDMMGGSITIQSEPGKGTEFHVILDLEKATIQREDMVLPPWRMLVVDNNKDLCLSAVEALKKIGVKPDWTTSGIAAVRMIQARHGKGDDYQIVLLDWKMPDMDGLETTKEIRKIVGDKVPILIISAYDWSDIEEKAREAGAHGFISKPLFRSNLYLGLTKYMGGGSEEEEEKKEEKKEENWGFTGMRILLAEDNELNWEIAEDILTDAGFEVDWAENGRICVEKFEQSEPGTYDVVLMDIRMPVMMGYEAAERIRLLDRPDAGLPIFAMTADAFSEDIQRSREAGMNEHIAKPIDVDRLMMLLKKYLKKA